MNILFDLSSSGLIRVSGHDAKKLLQGQLTCNLDDITEKQGKLAALCNPKGRIISLFYLLQFDGAYYLLMPHNITAITLAALKKYAGFYKVELADVSEQLFIWGYQTSNAPPSGFVPHPTDTSRFFLITHLKKELEHDKEGSVADWHKLEIEAGIPTLYPETSGLFLPHELNLAELNAISFNKGCYTGQEIIARMHYRGKLKKHMILTQLESSTPPLPGTEINHKEATGLVVSALELAYNHYQVLIIVEK